MNFRGFFKYIQGCEKFFSFIHNFDMRMFSFTAT